MPRACKRHQLDRLRPTKLAATASETSKDSIPSFGGMPAPFDGARAIALSRPLSRPGRPQKDAQGIGLPVQLGKARADRIGIQRHD
jgi:hypothetical protein